jgi:hypothetical protein
VRSGDWKYHAPHPYWQTVVAGRDGFRGTAQKLETPPALFNLREDIGEENNVIERYPDVAARLKKMLEDFDAELKSQARQNVKY